MESLNAGSSMFIKYFLIFLFFIPITIYAETPLSPVPNDLESNSQEPNHSDSKLSEVKHLESKSATSESKYIDNSVKIFFPPSLKEIQYSQTLFQVFWWNFIVIEPDSNGVPQWNKAEEICHKLQKYQGQELNYLLCGGNDLIQFQTLLKEWAQDIIYRKSFPSDEAGRLQWIKKSRQTLSKLALSTDQNLLEIMRNDPFGSWEEFLELNAKTFDSKFIKQNGFLIDEQTQRLILPIQFKVPPQMSTTEKFMTEIPFSNEVQMIGNHQASYWNEKTVHDDLNTVSRIGFICLFFFVLFLIYQKRTMAIFLILPTGVGVFSAAMITILYYGSIHGLSLAFGSAIAGLALDYALHGAFNSESKQTWKSNLIGLLTTLAGLGVLIFCRIPLIEQMMFFSIWGIIFGFISSYLICEFLPQYFHLKGLSLKLPKSNAFTTILIVILMSGWLLSMKSQFNFDLRRFNFQSSQQKNLTEWFYKAEVSKPTYLFLKPLSEALKPNQTSWEWSQKNTAEFEGILKYLPDENLIQSNLASWSKDSCSYFRSHWNTVEQKIYLPFLNRICENKNSLSHINFDQLNQRNYLKSYIGDDYTIQILRTHPNEGETFKKTFPEVRSLADSLNLFSEHLSDDLKWMIPLAISLSLLILFIYYQNLIFAFTAILPFLSGVGCFFIVTTLTHEHVDLISVLGLLMVFGFSIDYGVFATDLYIKNDEALKKMDLPHLEQRVFSTLTLAAITNIVGFFPLLFAQHTVLHQLGYALFFGTLGTYFGTIWGVPAFLNIKKSRSFL